MIDNQLFCGDIEPNKVSMKPIENQRIFTKAKGGLWTSTYNEHGSDWVLEYKKMWGIPSNGLSSWLIIPKSEAKVYTVDSLNDLKKLHEHYDLKSEIDLMPGRKFLDYEKMSLDYDGLHLTKKGQRETRLSMPHNLYGWDCESTHWFRWAFVKISYFGKFY